MQAFDFLGTSPSGSDSYWRVPQNSAPQLILSASSDVRAHASVFNHSSAALYLKYGSNVGMTVSGGLGLFDVRLSSGSYFELPKPMWQGQVWGAWDADAPGSALVVQLGRAGV